MSVPRLPPKRLRGLVQIAVSALLLALILHQVHWAEVWDALRRIELGWLGLAWAMFLIGVVIRAARWQTLLDALRVHRPLGELIGWYFVGSFFNVILPTGFGGDVVRVAELAQDSRQPGPVLNSVLVDRYLGIMVLLAMGLGSALFRLGAVPSAALALILGLFGAGLGAAWLLRRPWWSGWERRAGALGWVVRLARLPALADAVAPYDRRAIGKGLAISFVFNVLQIIWNLAIARGLGLSVPVNAFLVFVPLTAVALLLPAVGGLGVRELTYVGLFGSVGAPEPAALALSLGVYAITLATGLVGGGVYLLGGIRRAQVRDRQKDFEA